MILSILSNFLLKMRIHSLFLPYFNLRFFLRFFSDQTGRCSGQRRRLYETTLQKFLFRFDRPFFWPAAGLTPDTFKLYHCCPAGVPAYFPFTGIRLSKIISIFEAGTQAGWSPVETPFYQFPCPNYSVCHLLQEKIVSKIIGCWFVC
jgi:hypothetical protein